MWNLWQRTKSTHSRPSEWFDGLDDALARYCLDSAVVSFGVIVENALAERVEVRAGKQVEWQPKYTLSQVLAPDFYLPRPKTASEERREAGQMLRMLAAGGKSGVKRWRAR